MGQIESTMKDSSSVGSYNRQLEIALGDSPTMCARSLSRSRHYGTSFCTTTLKDSSSVGAPSLSRSNSGTTFCSYSPPPSTIGSTIGASASISRSNSGTSICPVTYPNEIRARVSSDTAFEYNQMKKSQQHTNQASVYKQSSNWGFLKSRDMF